MLPLIDTHACCKLQEAVTAENLADVCWGLGAIRRAAGFVLGE